MESQNTHAPVPIMTKNVLYTYDEESMTYNPIPNELRQQGSVVESNNTQNKDIVKKLLQVAAVVLLIVLVAVVSAVLVALA